MILDTLKKFVSIMDKERSSLFANRLRRFSKAGGACVALAHVNKHGTPDGRPIYAGTSDFVEDFDAAYLMYELGVDPDTRTRTVTFENFKARGDVAKSATYRYSIKQGLTYRELFDSVQPVDDGERSAIALREGLKRDEKLIKAIGTAIDCGVVTKTDLLAAVSSTSNASRRAIVNVLDVYCGPDASTVLWTYVVREHGTKKYQLTPEGRDILNRDQ